MSDTSQLDLNAELQPTETVCFSRRVTAGQTARGTAMLLAFLGGILALAIIIEDLGGRAAWLFLLLIPFYFILRPRNVTGEVIITDRRILYKFDNQPVTRIALGDVVVAQLLNFGRNQYSSGAHSAYYRLTLADRLVHRVFVLGDYETFADCLPTNVKIYKTHKDLKGGRFLLAALVVGLTAGLFAGLGAGMLGIAGLAEWFRETDSVFWGVSLLLVMLFGTLFAIIIGGYVGYLMGISVAFRHLKKTLSLAEAKELATFALALDFGGKSVGARINLKTLVRHLERTLSHAYRQPVQLP